MSQVQGEQDIAEIVYDREQKKTVTPFQNSVPKSITDNQGIWMVKLR